MAPSPKLTSDEFDLCGEAFNTHVLRNGFGRIDSLWKLRNVLQMLGQCPTDEYMQTLLPYPDSFIGFDDFVRTIEAEKAKFFQPAPPDSDTVQAFVAMGGSPEKDGEVSSSLLSTMVKNFDLSLDIDKLIKEVDTDGSGCISYGEFAQMFNSTSESSAAPNGNTHKPTIHKNSTRDRELLTHRARVSLKSASFMGIMKREGHDEDAPSEGSDSAPSVFEVRVAKTLTVPIAAARKTTVIASGAKKTSESRRHTRDELLAVKLKRLDQNLRRLGMIGGELPAITTPLPCPTLIKRQSRRFEAAKKFRKEINDSDTVESAHVFPGRRHELRSFDFSQRLMLNRRESTEAHRPHQFQGFHNANSTLTSPLGLSRSLRLEAAAGKEVHHDIPASPNANEGIAFAKELFAAKLRKVPQEAPVLARRLKQMTTKYSVGKAVKKVAEVEAEDFEAEEEEEEEEGNVREKEKRKRAKLGFAGNAQNVLQSEDLIPRDLKRFTTRSVYSTVSMTV